MPTAVVPERAAVSVALPLPQATSSTLQPACRSALSASSSLTNTMRDATTAKSPLAHVCCCRVLTRSRSSVVDVVAVITVPPPSAAPVVAGRRRLRSMAQVQRVVASYWLQGRRSAGQRPQARAKHPATLDITSAAEVQDRY